MIMRIWLYAGEEPAASGLLFQCVLGLTACVRPTGKIGIEIAGSEGEFAFTEGEREPPDLWRAHSHLPFSPWGWFNVTVVAISLAYGSIHCGQCGSVYWNKIVLTFTVVTCGLCSIQWSME